MILEGCHTAYVNLDHRTDRRVHMENTLSRLEIVAERVRGMLPSEYKGPPSRIACMLSRPQKGAIGCWFSQIKIMETAMQLRSHAFVMEDDLVFCADFHERMRIVSDFCSRRPWDVIWLGGTFHVNPPWWHKGPPLRRDCECTDHPRMMRTYGAFSTHAYIVNAESLPMILKGLENLLPVSMGIDWAFIQMQPQLQTFAFVPGCVIQYDNESDIGKGQTTFSNFKKLGPYWFQERMEDFDPKTFNWHEAAKR